MRAVIFFPTIIVLSLFFHQICCSAGKASDAIVIKYNHPEDLVEKFVLLDDKTQQRVKREATDLPTKAPVVIDENHEYYTKSVRINHEASQYLTSHFDRVWSANDPRSHTALDNGHRIGLILTLRFPFVFYGHVVNRIVVTTGGYLYMNDVTHSYLGFSQYVAPLMADFDTLHNSSGIEWIDTEDAFWVRWTNLQLNESRSFGNFTFQCAIFKNGSIVFDYISIPKNFHEIRNITMYKVHIGLSDAYYYDYYVGNLIYRYIVKYHDVSVDYHHILDETVVNFTHLITCNMLNTCEKCNNASAYDSHFNCAWCHAMSACSSGVDRQLQAWQNAKCHNTNDVCAKSTTAESTSTTVKSATAATSANAGTTVRARPGENSGLAALCPGLDCDYQPAAQGLSPAWAVLIVLSVILILFGLGVLVFVLVYGYRNPNSDIGRWMIENRPSRLRERMPEFHFKKSSGDMYRTDSVYDNATA